MRGGFFYNTKPVVFTLICMIRITQGQANSITVTASEKTTLESPVYLFAFTHDQTKTETSCIAADVSEYPERYNRFTITEKSGPNRLAGEIRLENTGDYTYRVYEQSSSTNLDTANATALVETGKCKVEGTASGTSHAYTSQRGAAKVYNG